MFERVPSCPDCGEPAKAVKDKPSWFRCPACRAVWKEEDWERRIAMEQVQLADMEKMQGVNSLIAVRELQCDTCGRAIKYLEKYCYDTRDNRNERCCVDCSLKAGYLRMIENIKTGQVYPARLICLLGERLWDGVERAIAVNNKSNAIDETCKFCGLHLISLKWSKEHHIFVCDNSYCALYHNPQGGD